MRRVRYRRWAIAPSVRPSATSARTSRSRGVSRPLQAGRARWRGVVVVPGGAQQHAQAFGLQREPGDRADRLDDRWVVVERGVVLQGAAAHAVERCDRASFGRSSRRALRVDPRGSGVVAEEQPGVRVAERGAHGVLEPPRRAAARRRGRARACRRPSPLRRCAGRRRGSRRLPPWPTMLIGTCRNRFARRHVPEEHRRARRAPQRDRPGEHPAGHVDRRERSTGDDRRRAPARDRPQPRHGHEHRRSRRTSALLKRDVERVVRRDQERVGGAERASRPVSRRGRAKQTTIAGPNAT